jgi:ABC-type spermidine/putrescine transport system permease subunit II
VDAVRRRWIAPSAVVWLLVAAAFFLIPLIATLLFSLRSIQTNKCCSADAYSLIIHDHQFWTTIRLSFLLSLETIAISLLWSAS